MENKVKQNKRDFVWTDDDKIPYSEEYRLHSQTVRTLGGGGETEQESCCRGV